MISEQHRRHLELYWRLARDFFEQGHTGLAAFFGVTLIEEVGKLLMLLGTATRGRKKVPAGFRQHAKKYDSAVASTLFVNSRVTRIYGAAEDRFAKWYSSGDLFKIRNRGIYAELDDGNVVLPDESVTKADALLIVCFAGEVYAEIQGIVPGTGPEEWQRLLKEVDSFRGAHEELLHDCLSTGQ